jgi:transmembrane protein 33
MKVVAYAELLILGRVFFGAILRQNSLVAPLIYAHFLRARYHQSAFTRGAIGDAKGRIEARIRQPGVPPFAVQAWDTLLMLLNRWAGATIAPAQPAPAPAR